MKFIKIADLNNKLQRAGNPSDPILIQVCRLDDTKNYLNWNNITAKKGGELALIKEIDNFFESGKARKVLSSQLAKAEKEFEKATNFESEKKYKFEATTLSRSEYVQGLSNLKVWEEFLINDTEREDLKYTKSRPFLFVMIASNFVSSPRSKPSFEALEKIYGDFGIDPSQGYIEKILISPKKIGLLSDHGITQEDVSGNLNELIIKMQSATNSLDNKLNGLIDDAESLVGYDPTISKQPTYDETKEKYRGMDDDDIKIDIYGLLKARMKNSPDHIVNEAVKEQFKKIKQYLEAIPIEDLDEDERTRINELRVKIDGSKKSKDQLNTMLTELIESRSRGEAQIKNSYEEAQTSIEVTGVSDDLFPQHVPDGWYCLPGKQSIAPIKYQKIDVRERFSKFDWKPFAVRQAFLMKFAKGSGWCLATAYYSSMYIEDGNMIIYFKGNTPKSLLCYSPNGEIHEWTAQNNRPINLAAYGDEIYDIIESYPSLKNDLDRFAKTNPRKHNGTLPDLERDIENIAVHKKLNALELAKQIEWDVVDPKWGWQVDLEIGNEHGRRTTCDYLLDDQISACAKDTTPIPESEYFEKKVNDKFGVERTYGISRNHKTCGEAFVAAMKKQWFRIENNEKGNLSGKYPFLKKDHEVIDEVTRLVKKDLDLIAKEGKTTIRDGMTMVDLVRLNNQFGQIPLKDPEVRQSAFNALMKLIKRGGKRDNDENLYLEQVSTIIQKTGALPLFKKVAAAEGVKAIMSGDFKLFAEISAQFELGLDNPEDSEELENWKEEYFIKVQDSAAIMYAKNDPGLEEIDNFFGGRILSEENLPSLRAKAMPIIVSQIIECLPNKGRTQELKSLLQKFPEAKSDDKIKKSVVKMSGAWMVNDPEMFQVVDEIFDKELSQGVYYEQILQSAIGEAVIAATKFLSEENYGALTLLNKNFKGAVFLDDGFLQFSKLLAGDYYGTGDKEKIRGLMKNVGAKIFNSAIMDEIYDIAFGRIKKEAMEAMSQGDIRRMQELDRRVGRKTKRNEEGDLDVVRKGKFLGERKQEVIEASKDMAVKYAKDHYLSWSLIEKEPPFDVFPPENPIETLHHINSTYGGYIAKSQDVIWACANLHYRCVLSMNNSYFKRSMKEIENLVGAQTVKDEAKGLAKDYVLSNILLWGTINSKKYPNPIGIVRRFDRVYGGAMSSDTEILERCRNIVVKCSFLEGTPYYDKVRSEISALFGYEIVTEADYAAEKKSKAKDAEILSNNALDTGKYDEVIGLVTSFPELKTNRRLIKRVVFRFHGMSHEPKNAIQKESDMIRFDEVFNGAITATPVGRVSFQKIKDAADKERAQQPQQPLPQPTTNKPPDLPPDDINQASDWYNVFKTSCRT